MTVHHRPIITAHRRPIVTRCPRTPPTQVCNRVLSDSQADVRTKRARGLIVMGRVFRSYGSAMLKLERNDIERHFQHVGEQYTKVTT